MRDLQRARGDRRQHGVEVERGGDRAADLLQHLQLADRLREIARALLDLGFEHGIGLAELAGHRVELLGELFQLVIAVDLDALAEIAGAEPARAGAQRVDRHQHAPRHHGACDDRDDQAEPDQERDAHQLVADRGERGRGRLLEEHGPAELRHHGGRGQHRMAVDVGAAFGRHAILGHHRRDLRQSSDILGDVGALRRGREHLAARIDDEGEIVLADLGIAEQVG